MDNICDICCLLIPFYLNQEIVRIVFLVLNIERYCMKPLEQFLANIVDAHLEHYPTVTAVGHSTMLSGATPATSGIIANEWFEVPAGRYLERAGCSVFAGHHSRMEFPALPQNAEPMSRAGIARISTRGARNVLQALEAA